MTKGISIAAVSALLLLPCPSFAQQGTTLAGPAQGSKANGSASTRPSGAGAGRDSAAPPSAGVRSGVGGGALSGGVSTGATQGGAGAAGAR